MYGDKADVIIVGGGLAGSALAVSLARRDFDVLLLEAELEFRDRVRGEVLLPWGAAEARRLGIHDLLIQAGARQLPYRDTYSGGELRSRRPFTEGANATEPPLSFAHASVQEALITAAEESGTRVLRGARLQGLEQGCNPAVEYQAAGGVARATAKLVVGADGRTSRVRAMGGFEVNRAAGGLMTTGVALEGLVLEEDGVTAAVNLRTRDRAALLPQGGGRARAYLTFRADSTPDGPPRSLPQLVGRMTGAGLPARIFANAKAVGPLATFDGTPRWADFPYREGVALVGDAASTSDPAWGQGMSLALRDVRVLVEELLRTPDLGEAAFSYARQQTRYSVVNRIVTGLMTRAQFGEDPAAESLRSSDFWRRSARSLQNVLLDGPDVELRQFLLPALK